MLCNAGDMKPVSRPRSIIINALSLCALVMLALIVNAGPAQAVGAAPWPEALHDPGIRQGQRLSGPRPAIWSGRVSSGGASPRGRLSEPTGPFTWRPMGEYSMH